MSLMKFQGINDCADKVIGMDVQDIGGTMNMLDGDITDL